MLKKWTEILPLFIVRILAKKYAGTIDMQNACFHQARPDVYIKRYDYKKMA